MFGSFPSTAFIVHVTQYEGRTLEQGECRFAGSRYAIENPREHFMHERAAELHGLRARKTISKPGAAS
jgi:hypothetical protein